MPTSKEEIQALIDDARLLIQSPGSTTMDYIHAKHELLSALDGLVQIFGPHHEEVADVHNELGLVFFKLGGHLEEAEAHYTAASEGYRDNRDKATALNNHAALLEAHGKAERDDRKASSLFRRASSLRSRAFRLIAMRIQATPPILGEELDPPLASSGSVYMRPGVIMAELDKVAIGQRSAKRGLANAAAEHILRMQMSPDERALTDKSNVMLLGPTGCGKTLLAEALARTINVPFYRTEATRLSGVGYVGDDVQSILYGLLKACDFDVERAQSGIIFLDEIDKTAKRAGAGEKDVSGERVQQELLTILEGTRVSVAKDGNKSSTGDKVDLDTSNILFIMGGAFVGLAEIVSQRLASRGSSIGFGASLRDPDLNKVDCLPQATAEDFVAFGMLPEFVGRVPKRLFVDTLSVEQLERILVEPRRSLLAQKRLLMPYTDLRFNRSALRAIAEAAREAGTNGRALREIVEQVLEPVVFNQPPSVVVTAEMVRNRLAEIEALNKAVPGQSSLSLPDYVIDDEARAPKCTRAREAVHA
jgi:ATP-dependent Clp protease ATP-binding subunit ClpX